MKSVCAFDKKCKTDIKEEFKLNINLQGPQGCVSSVYSSNVSKHVSILEALRDDYPDQKAEIRTSAIGSKPNESTFSLIRGRQLTPDAFEFGRIFPKLVREHVLKCSADPEFLYVTNQKKSHYEQSTGFYRLEVPSIPKIHKADPLSHENLLILRDYKANYLQGVRQNTIRNQNMKSKAGTFPLYAYLTQPPEASPLNFAEIISGEYSEPPSSNRNVVFTSGTSVLINAPDIMSDVVLAEILNDVHEGETVAAVRIHHNDIDNPLVLINSTTTTKIKLTDILKEVQIDSFDTLTEAEYISILDKGDNPAIPTDNEEIEAVNGSDIFTLASFLDETSSKRQRRFPRHLAENYQME